MFGEPVNPALQADPQPRKPDWLERASSDLDWLIEQTGIPKFTSDIGRGLGGMFGMEELGAELGGNLPRDVVNLAPAFFGPAGMAASAALSGASGYERSGGNVAAGLVSGALAPLTPVAGRAGGQMALRALGAPAAADTGLFVAENVGQRLTQYLAENVAATGLGEVGGQATSVASGQGLYNPFTPENVFTQVVGNIPFAVLDLPNLFSPLARRAEPQKPFMGTEVQNLRNLTSQGAKQTPANRINMDDDGNISVVGLDGKARKYTNLAEADQISEIEDSGVLDLSIPTPEEPPLPDNSQLRLEDIKKQTDAPTKLEKLMAFGVFGRDVPLTAEVVKEAAKLYMFPEEATPLTTGRTAPESVTRFLEQMYHKEDEKAKLSRTLSEPLSKLRAKMAEMGVTLPANVHEAAIAAGLKPEYAQVAREVIEKYELKAVSDKGAIERASRRISELMAKEEDPRILAALQQELDFNARLISGDTTPEGYNLPEKYDPELAKVLEDVVPEEELTKIQKGLRSGREISDATPYLYAHIFNKQEEGVPANEIRVRKDFIIREAMQLGVEEEVVPNSHTFSYETARAQVELLNQEAEKGISYRINKEKAAEGAAPSYYIRKKTNNFRALIDNKDIGMQAPDQTEAGMMAVLADVDPLEWMDSQEMQESITKESKGGVRAGLDAAYELVSARRRLLLEQVNPGVMGRHGMDPVKGQLLLNQMKVLADAMMNPALGRLMPQFVIPRKASGAPYLREKKVSGETQGIAYDIKMPQDLRVVESLMESAGFPFSFTPANRVRDVQRDITGMMRVMAAMWHDDGLLRIFEGKLNDATRVLENTGPGETYEYVMAQNVVEQFLGKAKLLNKKLDLHVVQDDTSLRTMYKAQFGEKKGSAKFEEYLKQSSGGAEGYYDKDTKSIVVIADNVLRRPYEVTFDQSVNRVLWHESAGHFGLQQVLGNEYNATLRRVLNGMPDDARTTIAQLYTGGNKDHPVVAAEYLARMAEKDPQINKLQEFYGNLRNLARRVGKRLDSMDDLDMAILVKRSRDYLFREAGIHRPNTSQEDFEDRPKGIEPNPQSPNYSLADRYLKPGNKMGWPTAYDVVNIGAKASGLDETEAHSQASRAMGAIRSGDAIGLYQAVGKEFTAPSPFEGHYMTFKAGRSPREMMSKAIQAKTLHDGFGRSLSGVFNEKSPVLARRNEIAAWAARTPMDVKESVLRGLAKVTGSELGLQEAIQKAQVATEFPNAVAALAANAITARGGRGFEEIAKYAPKPVAELVRALVKEGIEDARYALGVRQAEEAGITQSRLVSAEQKKALEDIYELRGNARKIDDESERVANMASKMTLFEPENVDPILFSLRPEDPRPKDLAELGSTLYSLGGWRNVPEDFPKKPNAWQRTFELASNLAESFPEFYPFLKTARAYTAKANAAANEIFKNFGFTISGRRFVPTPEAKTMREVAVREDLRKALDVLRLRQNEKVDDDNRQLGISGRLSPTELQAIRAAELPGISDTDFQKVTLLLEQSGNATREAGEVILRSRADRLAHVMKMYLGKRLGFTNMGTVKEFSTDMAKFLYDGTPVDYARYQAILGSADVAESVAFLTVPSVPGGRSLQETYETMKAHYRDRDGYLPEVRFGDYKIQYVDAVSGKVTTIGARDDKEVKKIEQKLYADGTATPGSVKYQRSADIRARDMGLGKTALEAAMEKEEEEMSLKLRPVLGDALFDASVAPYYEPLRASMQAELEKTMGDYMKKRGLKAGREQLDTLDTLMSYIPAVAYGASRSYVKNDASFYMNDKRLADNPVLRDTAKQEIDNALRVASGGEKAVKELAFQYFMALNPSTMVLELTQSLSTLAPWLTRHGAGFAGAYKELMGAYTAIGKARIAGRYSDPQLEQFSKRAVEEGVLDKGLWQEYEDPHRNMRDALTDITAGRKTVKQAVDLGKSFLQMTRNWYGQAAFLNNRIGFVAGYQRGRAMGLRGEELYEFASRTVGATMFSGGRANRSIGLYSAEGPVGGTLAATFGSLQSYFFGMVGTMARSIKDAYREAGGRQLSSQDAFAARKSMAQLFGTQLFLAGALGMPGAQAALAVLEQLFPEAELKKAVREMPAKLLGDSQFSALVGETMLYGAPTATLPIDVSGRVGLSNILGISNLEGFSPEQLFGPVGSIAKNLYNASQELQRGNVGATPLQANVPGIGNVGPSIDAPTNILLAAEKAAPVTVKNIVKWLKDDGVVRDYSGNAVLQLSGTDRLLQGLGFRSKDVARLQDVQSLAKRTEAAAQHREQALTRDLAQRMLSGDGAGAVARLSERVAAEPSYDIRTAARRAARKATDMTLPTELGRGGTLRSAQDIGEMIRGLGQTSPSRSTEMSRLMQQAKFLAQLRIPGLGIPSRQEIMNAAMIDQMRAANPHLTADEAKLQLERRRVSTRPPVLPPSLGPMFGPGI